MDAINTLSIIDTVMPNNGPYQHHPHFSGRGRKVVSKTGLSKSHPHFFPDVLEGDGLVLNNNPYQDNKYYASGQS